ncbi:MAG: YchJ family protein [Treponema sp.]|jgi:SEC-C motif-containing protein|nr:YchJ family protein [Treponema sp.]
MKICPCGSGRPYDECCGPYIKGAANPPTAEALMRSRYSAYVEHEVSYLMDTCIRKDNQRDIDEKSTRDWSEQSTWLGLSIISTEKGGPDDTEGVVEFSASYERKGLRDLHHETGRFKKISGRWLYDEGTVAPVTMVRAGPKIGRNDPCPCGSGKKYKHCCGH